MRTEPCVCGGSITAPSLDQSGPYIEGHNVTPEHFAWRLRNGISRERLTAAQLGASEVTGSVCTPARVGAVRPPLS